ncbi:MAG: bactofilin family protein [Nitrospiraceae bacterium]
MWGPNDKKKDNPGDDENFTFLGKGVDFKGIVNFDGTVRIDGRLEGEIHTRGTLIVGDHAMIKGIISVGTLITSGKINGTVSASEKVQILKPAVLVGDVKTPAISVEEGAHLHGMCEMGANKWVEDKSEGLENVHDLATHRGKVRVQELKS